MHLGFFGLFILVISYGGSYGSYNGTDEEERDEGNAKIDAPNVIIFLADDLGYGDLGISGHPTSKTPNIDNLANNGRIFNNYYVTSPICSPSRSSLLTGRYAVRNGVYPGTFTPDGVLGLPNSEVTIANVLKNKGYATQMVGKWHLGVGYDGEFLPTNFGFDGFLGLPYSHDMCPCTTCFPNSAANSSCYDSCWTNHVSCALFKNEEIIEQPTYFPDLTPKYLAEALKFINQSNEAGQPFFLYFPFQHIHHPQFSSGMFYGTSNRGIVGDSLLEMDWAVGEVMNLLESLGLVNQTLVWFTSDNGPSLMRHERGGSAGPLRCGKGTTMEGGVRVPSIVHWPGIIEPGISTELVSALDILPTIAKLTGADVEGLTLDGVDATILLMDSEAESPRIFYAVYPEHPDNVTGPFAVYQGKYKAHFYTRGSDISDSSNFDPLCPASHTTTRHDPPMLFNLYEDPSERYDLSDEEKYGDILASIIAWRDSHMASMTWMEQRTQVISYDAEPCCSVKSSYNVTDSISDHRDGFKRQKRFITVETYEIFLEKEIANEPCNPFPMCCDCSIV